MADIVFYIRDDESFTYAEQTANMSVYSEGSFGITSKDEG